MPDGVEDLHCVQAALDADGLRFQVLDTDGQVRKHLAWPPVLPLARTWQPLLPGPQKAAFVGDPCAERLVALRFEATAPAPGTAAIQALFCAAFPGGLSLLWMGLRGPDQTLTVVLGPEPGCSPHYWRDTGLVPGTAYDLQLMIHVGMRPLGILVRMAEHGPWTSLAAPSPWERSACHGPSAGPSGRGWVGKPTRPSEARASLLPTRSSAGRSSQPTTIQVVSTSDDVKQAVQATTGSR